MKRTLKVFFVAIISFCLLMSGCQYRKKFVYDNHPSEQLGSTWVSDDGTVIFYRDPERDRFPIYGTLQTEDEIVDIVISMGPQATIVEIGLADAVYAQEENQPFASFAYGHGYVVSEDEFAIEISEAEKYFEHGQRLAFYRTCGNENGFPVPVVNS